MMLSFAIEEQEKCTYLGAETMQNHIINMTLNFYASE